jgi:hypothetical protein
MVSFEKIFGNQKESSLIPKLCAQQSISSSKLLEFIVLASLGSFQIVLYKRVLDKSVVPSK